MGKTILVFDKNGDLLNQIRYKTKTAAKKNFSGFKKHGMLDSLTGKLIKDLKFELI